MSSSLLYTRYHVLKETLEAISMMEEKWAQVTSRGKYAVPTSTASGKNSHPASILGYFRSSILASAKLTDQIAAVVPSHY